MSTARLTAVLLAASALFSAALRAEDSARAFLWEQANAQAATASVPEDYLKAANTYSRLVAEGARNGPLFLNLGSALVMAGDGANAAAAFARAERHLGATPEARQGLAAAIALQSGREQSDLPWSRTAFFWHFGFPCPMRALTALGGWSLFWAGVICRILFRRRSEHTPLRSLAEACMLAGGLIALVFSASTLTTVTQERHDSATWASRVFLSSSQADLEEKP